MPRHHFQIETIYSFYGANGAVRPVEKIRHQRNCGADAAPYIAGFVRSAIFSIMIRELGWRDSIDPNDQDGFWRRHK